METRTPLRVQRIDDVAHHVKAFELVHVDGAELPSFEAGAHIELQLPNQVLRCYSLMNNPAQTHRYQLAVHLSGESMGGSRCMHESLKVGDVIQASVPRNNFPLNEEAEYTCLIAGGIGITPLLSMIERLNALGRKWELHYCARTSAYAAFLADIQVLADASGNCCVTHFDQEPGSGMLDIAQLVQDLPEHTHVYCCGPKGMLEAFEAATSHCTERRHVEYFVAKNDAATEGGFEIKLARAGLTLAVPAGKSILDVVLAAGIAVQTSCREGICGSCETRILEGQADHRDALLSEEE